MTRRTRRETRRPTRDPLDRKRRVAARARTDKRIDRIRFGSETRGAWA